MLTALLIVIALVVAGAIIQYIATRMDRRRFPPPGGLIDVDGCQLHAQCSGRGSPPVVLEAGIAASSVGWTRVFRLLESHTRVCAYDRAGFAWSSPSTRPRTAEQFLRELRTVVHHAGRPAILVGHSFGGLLVRLYAAKYPEDVVGLVLVDPALVHEWAAPSQRRAAMLRRGVRLSRRGAMLARLGVVRFGLALAAAGAGPAAKLVAQASSGKGGSATTSRLAGEVSKLPREVLPIVRAHWCRPACFESMAAHLEALPAIAGEVERSRLPESIAVTVISGAHLNAEQLQEHAQLAASLPNGRHVVASKSGHWVHLDEPELIVEAIHEMSPHHR